MKTGSVRQRRTTNLAVLMRALNVPTRQLARRSGVPVSVIGALRSGDRDSCTLDVAEALADALGAPTDYLFDLNGRR